VASLVGCNDEERGEKRAGGLERESGLMGMG
jgi:hypothetical protein